MIAVQGLRANPYHTWVRNLISTKDVKSLSRLPLRRLRGRQKSAPADRFPDAARSASDTAEVMWPRDLLPDCIPNARIATYSYESNWRRTNVKTSLRKCAEQLLNILRQNRSSEEVSRLVRAILQ